MRGVGVMGARSLWFDGTLCGGGMGGGRARADACCPRLSPGGLWRTGSVLVVLEVESWDEGQQA